MDFTPKEQRDLQAIGERLRELRQFLNSIDVESTAEPSVWFERLAKMKEIQGNSNTDLSFIACLLAKDYLAARFAIGDFDAAAKSQSAPGLDIDIETTDGKRIVGEIKTTVPYTESKNHLGAQQKTSFKKDFEKLKMADADYKFFFVTDKSTFDVVQRKYASKIPGVTVVFLNPKTGAG